MVTEMMAVTETDRRLADLLAQAQQVARERGRPVLASWSQPVPVLDPIALFHWAGEVAHDRTLWFQPDAGFALVGIGAAQVITPTGVERFQAAGAAWQELLDGALQGGDGPGPVLLGGFAFDPERPSTALWRGFPDTRLVLPELFITLREGACWQTLNVVVAPDEPVATPALRLPNDGSLTDATGPVSAADGGLQVRSARPVADWQAAVGAAAQAVAEGRFEKVVLARAVQVEADAPFATATVLHRLREAYPTCYLFAIAHGARIFLGATPERLVRVDGGDVQVASLAGSIRRGATPEEDAALGAALLASAKDRVEHEVVVRTIVAALDGPCSDLQAPSEPVLRTVRNVHHLYTPVTARLRPGATLLDLVERLHPTPAVGGAPKGPALAYIRGHEGLDRGWYAAPVGWIGADGSGEFAVALRSALVEGERATLFAGCGIMADSDPAQEYAESIVKLRPMLMALGGDAAVAGLEEQ